MTCCLGDVDRGVVTGNVVGTWDKCSEKVQMRSATLFFRGMVDESAVSNRILSLSPLQAGVRVHVSECVRVGVCVFRCVCMSLVVYNIYVAQQGHPSKENWLITDPV